MRLPACLHHLQTPRTLKLFTVALNYRAADEIAVKRVAAEEAAQVASTGALLALAKEGH